MPWLDANSDYVHEDNLSILYYTCAMGNLQLINYVMSKRKWIGRDYDDGLKGAAQTGDVYIESN